MNQHYYDTLFSAAREKGLTISAAADEAAMAFLDGKPVGQGKALLHKSMFQLG